MKGKNSALLAYVTITTFMANGQIFFPQKPISVLPPAEPCPDNVPYCGGDVSKYPIDDIEGILNSTVELQVSPETMRRFFRPLQSLENDTKRNDLIDSELSNLACEARREIVPRYSRARNVNNKWVYLAQLGNREFQEVEVTVCRNPQQKCINDLDSPQGPQSTLCKQIFSTQKLLALDEEGNVNVDTFELPSACVCKTKIKDFIDISLSVRAGISPLISNPYCNAEESTQPISHERFDRGVMVPDEEEDGFTMHNQRLQQAASKVTPCDESSNEILCGGDEDPNYPGDVLTHLLYRHKLFANKEYFNKLFGKPCTPANPEELHVRMGFDLSEQELCYTIETYTYPKKAKNVDGVWKYIVNTDDYRQGVSVLKCLQRIEGQSCQYAGSEGLNPQATVCKQIYSRHSFLSISLDGTVDYDTFFIPSACACQILDKDVFIF